MKDYPINLPNLHRHTPLQVFEQAKQHLLAQNEKSWSSGKCYYRLNNQASAAVACAAGCFISDQQYDAEVFDARCVPWFSLVIRGYVPSAHADLINELQYLHDGSEVEAWPEHLDRLEQLVLAGEFGS